jgi:tetratricopeptide (TPR) repeat protein
VFVLLEGCSSERDSWTSKAFHNTTAHYNGYYYAREEIRKIEKTLWSSLNDDYNRILRLYPKVDSSRAQSYDQEVQEAVKMASLAIQRHPNSKWVDDAYILVGKARLYSLDWGNAIQTLKYVNTKSEDPNARHQAIIQLIRTFTEHREYANGQAAIDFLQKEKLSKTNEKNFLLEKAYFYQEQLDYDNVVRNLTQVAPMLKKKDRPGRIYFIIGQVYQKLGFESEAYNFYRKCIATNPEYEVDFYSRLYLAQVTEISRSKNVNAALKSFRKLLKDSKNKEFKDKIYYELGVFELKQQNLQEAISSFNKSIREGSNTRIDGEAYLRLGEVYYDTLRNYEISSAYYDSAITVLPKDYEGYTQIRERQEVLNDFVKNLNTIKWQDSLLYMAKLDSVGLYAMIDSVFKANEEVIDPKEAKRKRRRSNRVEIVSNTNNVFSTDGTVDETTDWYFGNPSAMSLGQTEFGRIWGNIALEDNWHRSLRSSTAAVNRGTNQDITTPQPEIQATEATVDPVAAEYMKINRQLPKTEEQVQEALGKIEDAYFNVGDIYYFKLSEPTNAVASFQMLLERFPESEYEPEILYKLYLIYKESDPTRSESYATTLKSKFPTSTFARILINPDYLIESSQAADRQKELYASAYEHYIAGSYDAANQVLQEAFSLGPTTFSPNLELLRILIIGKTTSIEQYETLLEQFSSDNAETEIGAYARQLLSASQGFLERQQQSGGTQYVRSLEEPHFFILVHPTSENMGTAATIAMERFNQTYFSDLKLKTSSLVLNDVYTLTLVADLPRVSSAIEYIRSFNEKGRSIAELRNHKFNSFVITKDNFDIFYRTKGLDEYLQFFEKNYPTEDP